MENNLYKKSYAFAVEMVRLYQKISGEKREYVLSKQLLRSGTSIGANVAEANGAISTADFSSKISLAYKETLETKYWLNLLRDTEYIEPVLVDRLLTDADELSRIMFSILKKTRIVPK
ncbi:four helix bundle protein [Nibribacter koreensis]|uniref:Four helix bundle protein n=1 Tax=Nibribacter koreensis TaxID=1084519 RepID=A0ABP8FQ18_9BACT